MCNIFPLDINEFYNYTLEDKAKSVEAKTEETCQLAEKWENHSPPVPSDKVDLAKRTLDDKVGIVSSYYCILLLAFFSFFFFVSTFVLKRNT